MKFNSKVVSLVLALCLVLGFTSAVYAAAPDVNGHWAQAEIEKWIDNGMAAGYPDGSFKPDNNITRAEFVTLLNRSLGQKDSSATCSFADVKASDWYYSDVASAAKAGYVNGYEDNTFKPDQVISRVEAGVIVARVLQLPAGNQEAINKFTDAGAIAEWAMGSISAMVEKNLLGGYPDGSFNPNAPVTRAESVVILDRAQTASSASVPVTGVKLSSSTLSISVGNYKQLTATVEPANASNKAVTWESSNTSIATVDNSGKVKGVAEGKATITVTTVGGKKTATCAAIVTRRSGGGSGGGGGGSDRDTVSEVTASPAAGAVAAGTTVTLSSATTDATIYYTTDGSTPNTSSTKYTGPITINTAVTIKAYAVKSGMDASEVASFDYSISVATISFTKTVLADPVVGTIVTVIIGDADASRVTGVTVKSVAATKLATNKWRAILPANTTVADDDIVCSTASEPPVNVPVTGVTLDKATLSIEQNTNSTLVATISPANATDKTVTWASSDPTIASVVNGTVTGRLPGSAVITVTTADGNKSAVCNVTVTATPAGNFIKEAVARDALPMGIDVWVTLSEGVTPDANGVTANGNVMTYRAALGKYKYHNDDWIAPTTSAPITISVTVNGVTQTQTITATSI